MSADTSSGMASSCQTTSTGHWLSVVRRSWSTHPPHVHPAAGRHLRRKVDQGITDTVFGLEHPTVLDARRDHAGDHDDPRRAWGGHDEVVRPIDSGGSLMTQPRRPPPRHTGSSRAPTPHAVREPPARASRHTTPSGAAKDSMSWRFISTIASTSPAVATRTRTPTSDLAVAPPQPPRPRLDFRPPRTIGETDPS